MTISAASEAYVYLHAIVLLRWRFEKKNLNNVEDKVINELPGIAIQLVLKIRALATVYYLLGLLKIVINC